MTKDYNGIRKLQRAKWTYRVAARFIYQKYPERIDRTTTLFNDAFESWYRGNFNPATGKITLYRFCRFYEHTLKDIVQVGVLPRAFSHRNQDGSRMTENQVIDLLRSTGNEYPTNLYLMHKEGADISNTLAELSSYSPFGEYDILNYWTSSKKFSSKASWPIAGAPYIIEAELDPNEAYRAGKLKFGRWTGGFDYELEWMTVGPVPKERIKGITDRKTGRNILA